MLSVNFIGCGRLGKTIGKLFHLHNIATIKGVLNSSIASSENAVAFIGQGSAIKQLSDLPPADVTFITTRDDSINGICKELHTLGVLKQGSTVAHCSGSLSSDILSDATLSNCFIASVHPVGSYANPELKVKSFAGTFCSFEGDDETMPIMKSLFEGIGGILIKIIKENKKQYHAASVMANNYLVTLHYHAVQNYINAGIDKQVACQLVAALMTDAFNNLKTLDHERALTGPIQRGDIQTVKGHVESLRNNFLAKNVYSSLGRGTLPLTSHSSNLKQAFEDIFSENNDGGNIVKSRL